MYTANISSDILILKVDHNRLVVKSIKLTKILCIMQKHLQYHNILNNNSLPAIFQPMFWDQ